MNATTHLATRASIVLAAMLWATSARGEPAFSPRGYCLATGGAVVETGDPDVYICCYSAQQRCLAVNDRSRLSVRVNLPDDSSDASLEEAKPSRMAPSYRQSTSLAFCP